VDDQRGARARRAADQPRYVAVGLGAQQRVV
jgi:hypothetical protein